MISSTVLAILTMDGLRRLDMSDGIKAAAEDEAYEHAVKVRFDTIQKQDTFALSEGEITAIGCEPDIVFLPDTKEFLWLNGNKLVVMATINEGAAPSIDIDAHYTFSVGDLYYMTKVLKNYEKVTVLETPTYTDTDPFNGVVGQ